MNFTQLINPVSEHPLVKAEYQECPDVKKYKFMA